MKFSKRKKTKMRKINQRRINRVCKYMIGCTIDSMLKEKVIDQAKIDGIRYLLTENMHQQYAIYKIVKINRYVKLSVRRILNNKNNFINSSYWEKESKIEINEYGEMKWCYFWSKDHEHDKTNVRIIIAD